MVSKGILIGIAVGLTAVAVLFGYLWLAKPQPEPEFHVHADFKVFLGGKDQNFSQAKFMTTLQEEKSSRVHLHDLEGEEIHVHAKGVTLGEFLQSLGMKLSADCFTTDENRQYCNAGEKTLKVFVNGKPNTEFEKYEIKDLDRILISFGNENQAKIQQQIDSVSDRSCIFSGKCPQRGPAPQETCTIRGCQA